MSAFFLMTCFRCSGSLRITEAIQSVPDLVEVFPTLAIAGRLFAASVSGINRRSVLDGITRKSQQRHNTLLYTTRLLHDLLC
jgi:hypothetical protein